MTLGVLKVFTEQTLFSFSAISILNGVRVYGKEIRVTASKHYSVSMPKEGDVSCHDSLVE